LRSPTPEGFCICGPVWGLEMRLGRRTVLSPGIRVSGVAAAIVAVLPLHALATEVAHCVPPERALFSCITGTKTISVCGSQDLTANSGLLQYRFGRRAAVELSYPPAGADWRKVTRGGTLVFSGGGGAYLAFANAPYRYIVYSAVGQGWGGKAGVVVEKGRKQIANLACKGQAISELGPDLFSKAGIEEAGDSFEMP
jgi:hypothetical protein